MTKRIFQAIFGVATLMMLAVLALVLGMMYDFFSAEQLREMRSQAAYVGAGIEARGMDYLEQIAQGRNRITWVAEDGTVLFDSEQDAAKMDNHGMREEIRQALQEGEGMSRRYSVTLSEKSTNYALRLADDSVIRISSVTTSPVTLFFTMMQPLALILTAAILLSVFLAFQTAKYITRPLNDINLEQPELATVYDELTPLLRRIAVQNKQIHNQMRALRQQKQEFDTITSNMQEGLLVLDAQGDVLSYNKGAMQLMGMEMVEERKNVFCLNRSEGFRSCVAAALAGSHREESIQIGSRICQLFANPVIQDGLVAGATLVLFDVTEREEREKLRREFTANVSHELKTPLTSISGFAEIMQNGMVRTEDVPRFAGRIYDEAQRLIQMVQDIIKLSKLDENETGLEKEPVELQALVQDVVRRLEPIAQKKGIRMVLDSQTATISGIRQVLEEMIYNLCDNGIRYNHPDGMVKLSLRQRENEILLTVADTGMGIAPQHQERVFERFYRVNESRPADTAGSGLGLSIVKHGARLHNAKIILSSEQGKGTEIIIAFPKQ